MDVRLDGKCALITGGSRGLGYAMALKFAQSGASVAIVSRSEDKLAQAKAAIAETSKSRIVTIAADVGDARQVEAAYARAASELGRVDILVNNAGTSKRGAFEVLSDADWQSDFDLKLFGAIRLSRLALAGMKQRRWGRIINVVNIGAKAPAGGGAPTAVTRAAGIALTKVLANEFAPYNVLVNALCVGWFLTDQWTNIHRREAPDRTFDEFIKLRGKQVPVGRLGDAEEFANMACFLASDAGSYVTGVAINVDGGRSPVV
jgi:3-oxoacyl-[acyl-carrier protein] reductase